MILVCVYGIVSADKPTHNICRLNKKKEERIYSLTAKRATKCEFGAPPFFVVVVRVLCFPGLNE